MGISRQSLYGAFGSKRGRVDFRRDANPPNLPGGDEATPPSQVTEGFLAEASEPPPKNGVGPGQCPAPRCSSAEPPRALPHGSSAEEAPAPPTAEPALSPWTARPSRGRPPPPPDPPPAPRA